MNSLQMYCRLRGSIPHVVGSVPVETLRSANLSRVTIAAGSRPAIRTGGLYHQQQVGVRGRLCSKAEASSSNTAGQSSAAQQGKAERVPATAKEQQGSSGVRGKGGVASLWRNPARDLLWPSRSSHGLSLTAPPLPAPNRLGSSLAHLSDSLGRVLRGLSPWRIFRRAKDDDDENHYRLKLDVPGLGKEDVKVTVEDGVLVVRGERRQDEYWSDDEEGEWWYGGSYGRYDASLVLPDDAEVDGIKAEVRNGVLYVTVPREGDKKKKDVREVEVT